MEKSFNSDVDMNGSAFHVQTEDWGCSNPYLVSRVFQNGQVIKTIKRPYSSRLVSALLFNPQSVRLEMKKQHREILDQLLSGDLSD